MGESKHSLYDHTSSPPLVPAALFDDDISNNNNNDNTIMMASHEEVVSTDGLVHHEDGFPPALVMADVSSTSSTSSSSSTATVDGISSTIEDERTSERMIGAGVAGGVLGFFLGGPILAAIAGFGVAYCTRKEDAAGDVARALGDVALSAKEKAQEVEQKHHMMESTTKVATNAWERAKELDRQTEVLNKVSTVFTTSVNTTLDFARRHRIMERSVDAVGSSIYYVMEKLANSLAAAPKLLTKDGQHSTPVEVVEGVEVTIEHADATAAPVAAVVDVVEDNNKSMV
jgi:hypothetical protein